MDSRNVDMNQRDGGVTAAPSLPTDQLRSRAGNMVFKSGPLFISSKGIGWTSWKKRWFILTRTSLVFFRSDPSIIPQRGSEVNLTLGGIDLNNSGSVVVREDKKLLTVLFPDGRDGRAFTLKAETSEDLYDWKAALENALAQAPSAALVIGQNGIFRNDPTDTVDMSSEQGGDRRPAKSLVVGRPILLALEDIDGAPSFLEKALTFVEQYGVKVEGIFRHAADVDDVDRRLQEYEQGKNEFSPEEDAHVIADCIKRVIRELPSSPVPASCCKALLEACRTDRKVRLNAMRAAISETFPEPNRLLLQRILKMMQIVASHKSENRMTSSAVAACMAPLLLGPLMAGDCELDNDFSMAGDSSLQLMQAAAAANHAQAIVITLLEEYNKLFGDDGLQEGSISPDLYSELEESGSEDEEPSDDDEILEDNGFVDSEEDLDADTEDDHEGASSETVSESSNNRSDDQYDDKSSEGSDSDLGSHHGNEDFETSHKASRGNQMPLSQHDNVQSNGNLQGQSHTSLVVRTIESCEPPKVVPTSASLEPKSAENGPSLCITKSTNKSNEPLPGVKRPTIWGRTSARKNLSMEAIDITIEDEDAVQRLETTKTDLQNRIAKEAKENALLHGRLERRKQALHERRLALEQDVARLQEQLQKEKDLRKTMEAGLNTPLGCLPIPANIDKKTKEGLEEIAQAESDIINLKQKVSDLHVQLNQQRKNNFGSVSESCSQHQQRPNDQARQKDLQEVEGTTAAPHHERSKRSEDTSSITDSRKVRTQNPPSLSKKQPADKQQLDSTVHETTKPVEAAATSSSIEPVTVAPDASSSSKKSGAKVEVNAFLSVQQDTSYTTDSEKVRTQNALSLPRKQPTEKKQLDSPFLLKKQVAEKQQLDSAIHDSTKSGVAAATSSSVESVTAPSTASSNSKKSAAKVEQGNVSTSSALAKLTTRLNFLKERRTQVVNELQNIEHGRGSDGHSLGPPPLTNSR